MESIVGPLGALSIVGSRERCVGDCWLLSVDLQLGQVVNLT